jgi:hypothetical protein
MPVVELGASKDTVKVGKFSRFVRKEVLVGALRKSGELGEFEAVKQSAAIRVIGISSW